MLERVKRKFSRTKSSAEAELQTRPEIRRSLSLTPSDEQIFTNISFSPETEIIERAPKLQTPSIATGFSERTVFNNVESGFLSLPTEVLVFLQRYLRPSSEVALRHTCSRFFHLFSTPSFYLSGQEKFDFVCMTERDQDPSELDRLVCGHCRELHPKSSFSSAEIRQPPLDRDCRQVWLCAHKALGYRKTVRTIKAGVDSPFRVETLEPCSRCRDSIRNRSVADRPEKGTSQMDLESSKAESLLISKIALMQAPAPTYNMRGHRGGGGVYREVFQVKDVASVLQAIDFRLCSHLKLGDPFILSKFCRKCIDTQRLPPGVKGPACISEVRKEFGDAEFSGKCKGTCFVRGCRTRFMFQSRESLAPDASGRRQVWLMISVYRWLGPLMSECRDSTWGGHTVDHKERASMRGSWQQWNREWRGKQCMPNWSICLLHPEDCNLR